VYVCLCVRCILSRREDSTLWRGVKEHDVNLTDNAFHYFANWKCELPQNYGNKRDKVNQFAVAAGRIM